MLFPGLLLLAIEALYANTHNNGSIGHKTHKVETLPGGAVKHATNTKHIQGIQKITDQPILNKANQ